MRTLPLALLLVAGQAGAAPYEREIRVESEEDLYELLVTSQISEDTFNTLVGLYRVGVDLNTATREDLYALPNVTMVQVDAILAYRKESGRIADPAELVAQGILTMDELSAIAPFIIARPATHAPFATDGWVRAPVQWSGEDARLPASALQARVGTLRHLTLGGALVLTRNRLGEVVYDPNRDALSARPPSTQAHLPKVYAMWEGDGWGAIAGSYRAGFAERLTFDDTDRYTPNGFYRDETIYRGSDLVRNCRETTGELGETPCPPSELGYVTPDFRWREGLFGVAGGARSIPVPYGWLQAYGFASVRARSIYQYEIYDRRACDDPASDDPACAAPDVYAWKTDPLAPAAEVAWQTLPDMFRETLAGGNFSYFAGRRLRLGVTGYGAAVKWLVDGLDLDFQEWSRYPRGGPFGAVGMNAAWGSDYLDVGLEATRSFDSMGGAGGGTAAILRNTATWKKSEVELSFRYYGTDYVNPYAGPIAEPDEYLGQRARDEVGARVKYTARLRRRIHLRALADYWITPSNDAHKLLTYVRADYKLGPRLDAGAWLQFADKDLGAGGIAPCYETPYDETATGEPILCTGRQYRVAARVRVSPLKPLTVAAQYQHTWIDDGNHYGDRMRQDHSAWLLVTGKPVAHLTLRGRLRYLDEGIDDPAYLERSVWAYLDATYRLPKDLLLRTRYDVRALIDDRASTQTRNPSVEHWLLAEVEAWF